MWRGLPVGLDHPRVVGPRLEDEFPPAGAARLKVDEGPDLGRPHVLRDEAVAPLQNEILHPLFKTFFMHNDIGQEPGKVRTEPSPQNYSTSNKSRQTQDSVFGNC